MSDDMHRMRGTWRRDRHGLSVVGATARIPASQPVVVEAPAHLKPETAAWYASVCGTWVLDAHHQRILQLACEAWDQGQAARAEVEHDGLTVATKDGGCKAHPCLTVATAARTQFASLIAQLELDDVGTPGQSK